MPNFCAAYGCSNSSSQLLCKEKNISFHHFPMKKPDLLQQWLVKVKRDNFKPSQYSRICSEHFAESCFMYQNFTNVRLLKPDAVPTIFSFSTNEKTRKRIAYLDRDSRVNGDAASCDTESIISPVPGVSTDAATPLNPEVPATSFSIMAETIKIMDAELNFLKSQSRFAPDVMTDKQMKSLVGFDQRVFKGLFYFLNLSELKLVLEPKDALFLLLVRLKTALSEEVLGKLFNISQSSVSRVLNECVDVIYNKIKDVNIWPTRKQTEKNMSSIFYQNYKSCKVIVDATEISIQKPFSPKHQQLTFSYYKNRNTMKVLIGICPSGTISFISDLWGGSISDKELFIKSGIIEKLEPGDMVMCDRGFTVKKEVEAVGASLVMPNFLKGKPQFSVDERIINKKVSNVRVHVERAIGRVKKFKYLQGQVPHTCLHNLNEIFYIIAFLTNFGSPIINP